MDGVDAEVYIDDIVGYSHSGGKEMSEELKNLVGEEFSNYTIIKQEKFPEPGPLTAPNSVIMGIQKLRQDGVSVIKYAVWDYNHQAGGPHTGSYFLDRPSTDECALTDAHEKFNEKCRVWQKSAGIYWNKDYECPDCGSHRLQAVFLENVSYTIEKMESDFMVEIGEKLEQENIDLDFIHCKSCVTNYEPKDIIKHDEEKSSE